MRMMCNPVILVRTCKTRGYSVHYTKENNQQSNSVILLFTLFLKLICSFILNLVPKHDAKIEAR